MPLAEDDAEVGRVPCEEHAHAAHVVQAATAVALHGVHVMAMIVVIH